MEPKLKNKLSKNNNAVISLYTWVRIKSFEIENKHKKNFILESISHSPGFIEELINEIKKPIEPIILKDGTKLLLEEDKNNLEENYFINKNKSKDINLKKRDINLIFIALEYFKGMIEYKNYNKILPDEIEKIARYIKYKFIPKNTYIFKEGDEPDNIFFIIKGRVQILEREYMDRTNELKRVYIGEKKLDSLNDDISEEENDENKKTIKRDININKESNNHINDEIEDEINLEPYWRTKKSMILSSIKNKKNLQLIIDKYEPDENEFKLSKSSVSIKSKNINIDSESDGSTINQIDKDESNNMVNQIDKDESNSILQKNNKEIHELNNEINNELNNQLYITLI